MATITTVTSAKTPSDKDVYSISDTQLAQRLRFVREIGAGNWGCVWLCSPKSAEPQTGEPVDDPSQRVAVKLVFREKKPTTAQRVRSLWNEMKIIRALKQDPHPSIIPFHSFIITPSFAIITMEYLPHLIPVEVPETKARGWFRCLLSAVHFLHKRGVVHNDIKPANILLSTKKVPMLVDFGFAEKYEQGARRAFMSNLAYGTPEYLSPERARGNLHDTRKSDMWSLGITFFEILVGRTPFEYVEGEKFTTPEDLERYWSRTVKGKWVGEWKMSEGIERMLRKMISPKADARCTASDAMKDSYWVEQLESRPTLSPAASTNPIKTPSRTRKQDAKLTTPSSKDNYRSPSSSSIPRSAARPTRRVTPLGLPPIEGSPHTLRTKSSRKTIDSSNSPSSRVQKARTPFTRKAIPPLSDENKPPGSSTTRGRVSEKGSSVQSRRGRVLVDSTSRACNVDRAGSSASMCDRIKTKAQMTTTPAASRLGSGSYDRVKAFERLKQLERRKFLEEEEEEMEEMERDSVDHEDVKEKEPEAVPEAVPELEPDSEPVQEDPPESPIVEVFDTVPEKARSSVLPAKQSSACMTSYSVGGLSAVTKVDPHAKVPKTVDSSYTLLSDFKGTLVDRQFPDDFVHVEDGIPFDELARSSKESTSRFLKHGLKVSVDKTLNLYKTSLGRINIKKSSKRASDELDQKVSKRESWENDIIQNAHAPSPITRYSLHQDQNEASLEDTKIDRLSSWVRNVEQVVREAKEGLVPTSVTPTPLPVRPVHRAQAPPRVTRVPRTPRKILKADQIFRTGDSPIESPTESKPVIAIEEPKDVKESNFVSDKLTTGPATGLAPLTPNKRRATISISPRKMISSLQGSPSKRREKAKSSGNLTSMVRPISPFNQIQKELEKEEVKAIPNLSELLDRSVFIARTGSTAPHDEESAKPEPATTGHVPQQPRLSTSLNMLKAVPVANALRESSSSPLLNGTPQKKHDGVYDRLRSTVNAKRIGRNLNPEVSTPSTSTKLLVPPSTQKKGSRLFGTKHGRSTSEELAPSTGASAGSDDLGFMSLSFSHSASFREDASKSVNAVRKAFKAIVTGKSASRRQGKVPL